jgi:RNA polymerase sigma-70 factor (ECF subfamily)
MASMVVSPAMLRLTVAPGGTRLGPVREDGSGGSAATRPPAPERARGIGETAPAKIMKQAHGPLGGSVPGTGPAASSPASVGAASEQAYLASLAASCLQGDARSWEILVRREQRRVYGLCYRFTGSATEAEDLTQDTFLKVYRNLASFDPAKAGFSVWLTALTRNLLVDHYRRSRLERATDSLDEPLSGEEEGPTRSDRLPDQRSGQERHVAGLELRARVQAALAKVSPELREAVILRDLQDMDYREIAEVLGIPQGTVKSRISRGRAELARLLKGMEGQVM